MALTPEEIAAEEEARKKKIERHRARVEQLKEDISVLDDEVAKKKGSFLRQAQDELQLKKKKVQLAKTEVQLAAARGEHMVSQVGKMKEAVDKQEKLVAEQALYAEKTKKIQEHWGSVISKLGEAGAALTAIGGSIKDMAAKSFELGKTFGDMNKSFGDVQLNVSGVMGTLTSTFAGLVAPIAAAWAGITAFGVAMVGAAVAAAALLTALIAQALAWAANNVGTVVSIAGMFGYTAAAGTATGGTAALSAALIFLQTTVLWPLLIVVGLVIAALIVLTGALMGAATAFAFAGGFLLTFMDAVIDTAISLYDAENAFMATTGASLEMAQGITQAYDATRAYGVSLEEVVGAQTALMSTFKEFTMLNKAQQLELSKTTAILSTLGVSAETSSKSFEIGTKMMGVGVEDASGMMLGLRESAQAIGVPVGEMTDAFAASGSQLAVFGEEGVNTFVQLQHAAKITGYEMSKILNLTDKFDTFEDSATMVGKLNAALGGNFLNAMDMMMDTDPVTRFESIRDAISDAGLSFDDMSYYQRKMYADALGMADVGDLALALSGDMSELSAETNKSTADYEKAAKGAAELQSVQDQWKTILKELTPVVKKLIDEGIRPMMKWMVKMAPVVKEVGIFLWDWIIKPLGIMLGVVGVLAAVLTTLTVMVVSPLVVLFGVFVAVITALTAGFVVVGTVALSFFHEMYEEFNKLQTGFFDLVTWTTAWSKAWDNVGKSWDKIMTAWRTRKSSSLDDIMTQMDKWTTAGSKGLQLLRDGFDVLTTSLTPLQTVFAQVEEMMNRLPSLAQQIGEAFATAFSPLAPLIDKVRDSFFQALEILMEPINVVVTGVRSITTDLVGMVEESPVLENMVKAMTVVARPAQLIEDMGTAAVTAAAAPAIAAQEAVIDVFAAMPDINLTVPVNLGPQKVGEFVASVIDGKLRTVLTS